MTPEISDIATVQRRRIEVPGAAPSKGSKRHVGHGVIIEANQKRIEAFFGLLQHAWATSPTRWEPPEGPVAVDITVEVPRPLNHYLPANTKREKPELRPGLPSYASRGRVVDVDKAARAVLDGLTAVGAYRDDKQVCLLAVRRYWTEAFAKTIITVAEITE